MPIIINSKFRPFSYLEMVLPVLMAALAHLDLEDLYAELDTKASIWEKLRDSEIDKDVYQLYKSYSDALRAASDKLTLSGLTPSSRREMLSMKSRYSKEITPIELAYLKREQEAQKQLDDYVKSGGKNIYTRDARTTRLSDYMTDKVLNYNVLNLDNVMNEGIAAGKAISGRYFRTEEGRRFGDDYYNLITRQGLTPQEAFAILNDPEKYPEFNKFILDTLNKYLIQNGSSIYSNIDTLRANSALMQGLNLGIMHDVKQSTVENWRNKLAAQEAKDKRVAEYTARLKNNPKSSISFGTRIYGGVLGEVNKDNQRLKGLKPNGKDSFTTDIIDSKMRDYDTKLKAVESYLDSLTQDERNAVVNAKGHIPYSATGAYMSKRAHQISQYRKLKKEADAAKASLQEEVNFVGGISKRYSHLGSGYAAIDLGLRLSDMQEKLERSSFVLTADKNEYDNVRARFGNIYRGFTKDEYDAKTVGLYDKDGDKMSYEDVSTMFSTNDENKKPTFRITGGKNSRIEVVYEGKEYSMLGVPSIESFNNDLSKTNLFLSDFSMDALNTSQGSAVNVLSLKDYNLIPLTDNFAGAIIYDAHNPLKMAKVIINRNNPLLVVAVNTLLDELSGGRNRDEIISNMSLRALDDISSPVKHK